MNAFLEELFSLEGKVALVTGAAAGMGAAIAKGLAGAGAKIAVLDRDEVGGINTRNSIKEHDGEALFFELDLFDTDKTEQVVNKVANQLGRLDIVVNAAGITLPQNENDTHAQRMTVFNKTIAINLNAAYAIALVASPHMAKTGGGSIINLTSIAAVAGYPNNPGYVASKSGLSGLGKALAMDLIKDNIRVNSIAPGYVKTAMTAGSQSDSELYANRLRHMIIPRWGEPEDMVGAAIFLASDASSYVTGQDIYVDGGWSAKGLT